MDLIDLLRVDLERKLDDRLLWSPHVKLGILKGPNYHGWAYMHRLFFEGRGIYGIVSGDLPMPTHLGREPAKRWKVLDRWMARLIRRNVKDVHRSQIEHLSSAKAIWDALKRIHGPKESVPSMLMKFSGYEKAPHQTIMQMVGELRRLRYQIADRNPDAAPTDIVMAAVLINACKGSEYKIAKYVLGMSDNLTTELAIDHLRSVEEWTRSKNSGLLARNGRGQRPSNNTAGRRSRRS